jgi:hypothetical protein
MASNQHTQEDVQEDISLRLAMISKAVEAKLLSKQQASVVEERVGQEQMVSACPIDPMERLQCESCQ